MTREETIKWLESLKSEIGKSEHRALWHYAEAIDMAIESLLANTTDVTIEYDIEYLPDKDGIHQAKATITKTEAVQIVMRY